MYVKILSSALIMSVASPVTAQPPSCSSVTAHASSHVQATTIDLSAGSIRIYANNTSNVQAGFFQVKGPDNQWIGANAQDQGDGSWFADVDLSAYGTLTGTYTLIPWLWNSSHGGVLEPCGTATVTRVATQSSYNIQSGTNYNWNVIDAANCSFAAASIPVLRNYATPMVRSTVQQHLAHMKRNGVDTLRFFAGWGDNAYQSGLGAYITPPASSLPSLFLDNLGDFLDDISSAGITSVIIGLGGEGSYRIDVSTDLTGLVIPTYKNAIDDVMQVIQNHGPSSILLDLGNEIAPSNYEPSAQITVKKQVITETWKHYVDSGYPVSIASYSSIMDDHSNLHIAGNRLNNLITTLQSTGRPIPQWFSAHVYGDNSTSISNMLRGVYQIYSDHGYLSGGPNPKWTMIGESFYEHQASVDGIKSYIDNFDNFDNFNNQGIQIRKVLSWPVTGFYPYCPSAPQQVQSPLTANLIKQRLD